MRTFLSAAFLAAGVAVCVADEPKKAEAPQAEAKKADEAKADATPKEKFAAIRKDLNAEMTAWSKDYGKAEADERKKMMPKRMEILQDAGKKAFTLARDFPKDDVALDALTMAMMYGSDKTKKDAGELVVTGFADDEKLLKIMPQLAQGEGGEKLMETLASKSKNKSIQGMAKYSMIEGMIEAADYPRTGKPLPAKEATAKLDAAAKKLDAIITEYGDVKVPGRRGTETTIAEAGKSQKFFLENLVVGKTLPDVKSELLDGKAVKVSDYRGKVVVLDIWATWCGPCRAMIPHERELTARLKDKKFEFISVSADEKKETLEKFLEKEEMPWTHWFNGRDGDVTKTLQVKFFPTVYVLDGKGVIRYKHVRGEAMDKAVDELLKEGA